MKSLALALRATAPLMLLVYSSNSTAHSFGQSYSLPVPFWLYGGGSVVALALSFLIAAAFMRVGAKSPPRFWQKDIPKGLDRILLGGLSLLALAALALSIVSGFIGHPNAYANINMTLFWIVFVLAFAYLSAVIGGFYAYINPWQNLVKLLAWPIKPLRKGLFTYPEKGLGYWPAIILYMAFIWVELFGRTKPFTLAEYLAAYSAINLAGSLLWGVKSWFRFGEFFSVFLRLFALAAPIHYQRDEAGNGSLKLRWPFAGLLQEQADHSSLVVFILFMLSSTAFDGLHETVPWQHLFWSKILPTLDPTASEQGLAVIITHRSWYLSFQWGSLLLSPFVYLAAYWIALWAGNKLIGGQYRIRDLAVRFAYSLLPIALVYHVTHYYTLLMTQGIKVTALISDPFGWKWDLFGTANWFKYTIIPDIATVWHVQVVTIVVGHIISVYIAHVEALKLIGDHRKATISQLPMLLLMMLFTTVGLWILAQPIQTGA